MQYCVYMICPPCDLFCGYMICPPCHLYCGYTIYQPCDLCYGYMICPPCDLNCGYMICPPCDLHCGYMICPPCYLYCGYMIYLWCGLCCGYAICPLCDLWGILTYAIGTGYARGVTYTVGIWYVRHVTYALYSETIWAVSIAQLTHHEVQGGLSGELIAQYWPPMSFCFYPTLYLGNHLCFLKPDSSWKQQKNTWISEIDSVHSNKRVDMVTPQHLLVTS